MKLLPAGLKRALGKSSWFDRPREDVIQWIVWLTAAGLCVVMLTDRVRPSFTGLARGRIVQLSVPWPVLIRAVPVEPFQRVRQGDVVALLDDDVLQAQIATIEAEIARLRAEHAETQGLLDADVGDRLAEWEADSRAFDSDTAQLTVNLQETQVDLHYDRALLEGLRANAANLERLAARGHAAPSELELARAEAEATACKVEENERLLLALEARRKEAEARRTGYGERRPIRPSRQAAADHLTQSIAVQQGLLAELESQRAQCVLRAPFDGTVVEIQARVGEALLQRPGEGNMRRPGESVGPGEPVVVLAADRPDEIVAYAFRGAEIEPGQEVIVTTDGPVRQETTVKVSAVGPTVERLPERLWSNSQVPEWGRPFVVPLPPGLAVEAGELVSIQLR